MPELAPAPGRGCLYSSTAIDNVIASGTLAGGGGFHLRVGRHGTDGPDMPDASREGFPYPGSVWLEVELIARGRSYSAVELDVAGATIERADGERPVGLELCCEAAVHDLDRGRDVDLAREPRCRLVITLPIRASGRTLCRYGLAGVGFTDVNYGVELAGGRIEVTPPGDAGPGSTAWRDTVQSGHGCWEIGWFHHVPRAVLPAYDYTAGQHLDLAGTLRLPPSDATAVCRAALRDRARRAELAEKLACSVRCGQLVTHADRTSPVELTGRTLDRSLPGRALSWLVISRLASEIGVRDASGCYVRYRGGLGLFLRPRGLIEPLVTVTSRRVPLRHGVRTVAEVERSTVIAYDRCAERFALALREGFHRVAGDRTAAR